ncbi:uncharacterized protein LOC131018473 [Salvia miltiorrhiza]|uniref:uncharacterized protein LOC131018473 n=1 Tax=Salvia miltiorrhiza TaxID=226208 RepID=UPI0025ABD430|nr:uncharacterized protein LOC131018473 [Salvia miltiorrhiza]
MDPHNPAYYDLNWCPDLSDDYHPDLSGCNLGDAPPSSEEMPSAAHSAAKPKKGSRRKEVAHKIRHDRQAPVAEEKRAEDDGGKTRTKTTEAGAFTTSASGEEISSTRPTGNKAAKAAARAAKAKGKEKAASSEQPSEYKEALERNTASVLYRERGGGEEEAEGAPPLPDVGDGGGDETGAETTRPGRRRFAAGGEAEDGRADKVGGGGASRQGAKQEMVEATRPRR